MATIGPTKQRHIDNWAANLLKLARIKAGVSQRELARRAGVPQTMISRIESGKQQPSLPTLSRVLAAIDLDLRIRLEAYDDHDDVLDRRMAKASPKERARLLAAHERLDREFREARPA